MCEQVRKSVYAVSFVILYFFIVKYYDLIIYGSVVAQAKTDH